MVTLVLVFGRKWYKWGRGKWVERQQRRREAGSSAGGRCELVPGENSFDSGGDDDPLLYVLYGKLYGELGGEAR